MPTVDIGRSRSSVSLCYQAHYDEMTRNGNVYVMLERVLRWADPMYEISL
jgi:hypothetical protein